MTQELYNKAYNLDARISMLYYAIRLAKEIKTESIQIIPKDPDDKRVLAILDSEDPLCVALSDQLVARLTAERDKLQEEFNNL